MRNAVTRGSGEEASGARALEALLSPRAVTDLWGRARRVPVGRDIWPRVARTERGFLRAGQVENEGRFGYFGLDAVTTRVGLERKLHGFYLRVASFISGIGDYSMREKFISGNKKESKHGILQYLFIL